VEGGAAVGVGDGWVGAAGLDEEGDGTGMFHVCRVVERGAVTAADRIRL
jgi:hypothetical protein